MLIMHIKKTNIMLLVKLKKTDTGKTKVVTVVLTKIYMCQYMTMANNRVAMKTKLVYV